MDEKDQTFEDEIDIRALLMRLWKARKVIFITTLIAAILIFIVSYWILPKQYQATAYVLVDQPLISYSQSPTNSGTIISPSIPDIKSLAGIATNPQLLLNVLDDPVIRTTFKLEESYLETLENNSTADAIGSDQLRLNMVGDNPELVAKLVNVWAEKVTVFVNNTYGLGTLLKELDPQVQQSKGDYEKAQADLEQALATSQVDSLKAKLDSLKSDLDTVLGNSLSTKRVINDLQFFDQGLASLPGDTPLSLGDGLALITLRQRSMTVQSGLFTIQMDSSSFNNFTISQARDAITQMRIGLQSQQIRLQSDQSKLEQEIPLVEKDLENAKKVIRDFQRESDQSYKIFADLQEKQKEITTILGINFQLAKVSLQAVPATKAESPRSLVNTVIAGFLGFILAVSWILFKDWIKGGEK
jgi:capsular polysaccharide biosynthesis protein